MSDVPTYQSFADRVRRLDRAIAVLAPRAAALGTPTPEGQEWFDLLRNKLLAELDLPPLLVVAIVGGTNIGKSAIFNHLAGEVASAASPLAAGTKHPVCFVPKELADPALLGRLFEPFKLCDWRSADDPLGESPENRLFWRVGPAMPPRLLLLDAPDVDSDAEVNWRRARAIRQTADVLVAVLTQQKYNDAAVKRFFRAAVEADKPIVVVFNQCEMEADAEYWPRWLATFRETTGARPELVYAVPYDRRAAEELRLPFYAISAGCELAAEAASPPGAEKSSRGLAASAASPKPASAASSKPDGASPRLRDDLAALRFDEIKIRTFRGALRRVLDPQHGLPAYLDSIRAAADDFSSAAAALSTAEMARVGWPSLPTGVLVDEIRDWWDDSRQPWSRRVHGFYRVLGRGATWPLRTAWNSMAGPRSDPPAVFRRREREAVVLAVEKLLDELDRLARVGNDVLRPRLLSMLGGHARASVLERVQAAHENLPAVDEHYRRFLRAELDAWRSSSPRAVRFLQSLDHAAAVARPAITVALFFTGLHFAGDLAGQAAAQAAGATAGHLAAEAAIAGGITGGGEALVSTTSEGVRQAAGRLFGRLQSRYARQRAGWLAEWLENELLGDLLANLRRGAEVPREAAFQEVEAAARALS
ncbi:MAG: GTPase domain-containing protein [Planctomycetes bacterium]|nr:GTPase domain-containing protein [Planctomycetota bacterium]